MSDLALDILREELEEFYCVRAGGASVIFYPVRYRPFAAYPKTCGAIDAYYFASNAAYHRTRGIAARLREAGVAADGRVELDYKRTLAEAGLMNTAVNTLCWTEASGTRFVLGALRVAADIAPSPPTGSKGCLACGRCAAACPTGAISARGFLRERCLRQRMATRDIDDDEISRKLGGALLGCDACQRVCPLNASVTPVPVPEDILAATDLAWLIRALISRRAEKLAALIGANYARAGKLLALAVNAMGNSGNGAYLNALRELDPEAVGGGVLRRAIRKLEGRHADIC